MSASLDGAGLEIVFIFYSLPRVVTLKFDYLVVITMGDITSAWTLFGELVLIIAWLMRLIIYKNVR